MYLKQLNLRRHQESSVGKGARGQTWWPEFSIWDQSRRKKQQFKVVLWPSHVFHSMCVPMQPALLTWAISPASKDFLKIGPFNTKSSRWMSQVVNLQDAFCVWEYACTCCVCTCVCVCVQVHIPVEVHVLPIKVSPVALHLSFLKTLSH